MTTSEQGPPPIATGAGQETNLAENIVQSCNTGKANVAVAAAAKTPDFPNTPYAATSGFATPPPKTTAVSSATVPVSVAPKVLKPWKTMVREALLTAKQLSTLEIPAREYILEPFLKVGDYGIIHAQRGVGKTW